jgi:hypothetical protein
VLCQADKPDNCESPVLSPGRDKGSCGSPGDVVEGGPGEDQLPVGVAREWTEDEMATSRAVEEPAEAGLRGGGVIQTPNLATERGMRQAGILIYRS